MLRSPRQISRSGFIRGLLGDSLPGSIFTDPDEPIRAQIFSISRLESHAESLAQAQNITSHPWKGLDIAPRIYENRRVLEVAFQKIIVAVHKKRALTPAAEWFVDNFHVVQSQLKDIHDHLPEKYYRELPKLAEGPLAGYPRIYGIAWAFVAHRDSLFDPYLFKIFLNAYQKEQPLTIGELWASSITLRLVLIENLRRISAHIVGALDARHQADSIADSLLGIGDGPPLTVEEVIEALKDQTIVQSFAVQLLQRLRFQEARVGKLLQFLDQKLGAFDQTIEICVSNEHGLQSSANITTRNIITSCRLISAFDWSEFFEQTSLVDQILRNGSDFSQMDFTTRDRYRHRLEDLARHSKKSEIEIAHAVVADPAHYLFGGGKIGFEKSIEYRLGVRGTLLRSYVNNASWFYLGSILGVTCLIVLLIENLAFRSTQIFPQGETVQHHLGTANFSIYFLVHLLTIILSSEIAIALVNRWTVSILGPQYLPRLSFETGIPAECRTLIVVPTMLTDESKIKEQLEQIEIHYLSNQDENIFLALLTDFGDSTEKIQETDSRLIEVAAHELRLLNLRHPTSEHLGPRFLIFHRDRVYKSHEKCWMGWERKRGKLHEFNKLVLGAKDTSYGNYFDSTQNIPQGVRFIITLDADTKMPRGSARQLIGAMAHPLNLAKFDERTGLVTSGYGILQPRVSPSLADPEDNTTFRRLSASQCGIDPYASAVSDVYQDLFQEGSYSGKGIYDLKVFELALQNRIPENSVLSHDLLEGNFARCGFLSDVWFFEDFPSHTAVAALRSHRWIRGDWQLLPWIFGKRGQQISCLGKWKMFDNLRRSLMAPAAFVLFFVVELIPDMSPWPFLFLFGLHLLIPVLISFGVEIWPRRLQSTFQQHMYFIFDELRTGLTRAFMLFMLLPSHAWTSADAVTRALYRLIFSRKKLLEWTTAAQAKSRAQSDVKSFWLAMRGSVCAVGLGGLLVFLVGFPYHFERTWMIQILFLIVLFLWIASPAFAFFISSAPKSRVVKPLGSQERLIFRVTARRIWHFFSTLVTVNENHLPPDNFQIDPLPTIAHRSSPTNFGLYLISILAAKDFGWIGIHESIDRLEATLKTMMSLQKFEGHFFNWYETTTKAPLEPRYISSVDNGNLTAHLFVVIQTCLEILQEPGTTTESHEGLYDAHLILERAIGQYKMAHLDRGEYFKAMIQAFNDLSSNIKDPVELSKTRSEHWESLRIQANFLVRRARLFSEATPTPEGREILLWCQNLQADILSRSRDYLLFRKWSEYGIQHLSKDASLETQKWWSELRLQILSPVSLENLASHCGHVMSGILAFKKNERIAKRTIPKFLDLLLDSLEQTILHSNLAVHKIHLIHQLAQQLIHDMDFKLLYDSTRKLFSIGMRVSDYQLDPSYYDLLASEARLTSFVAIAKGDVPVSHWFHLNRSLVKVGRKVALVSWSGSMFEYLMPDLVMRSPAGGLLDDTCRHIVHRQINYGRERNRPWGISESAYNKRDLNLTYQYSNFGVPELGLKRGLGSELVVAPYASFLAALYEPAAAAENLLELESKGAVGGFGFYESLDFTPSRVPEGRSYVIVKTYMAHHQGMALVALSNIFNEFSMQKRFHANPFVQATELLLQERTPLTLGVLPVSDEVESTKLVKESVEHVSRRYHAVNRPVPTTQLLSNGNYMTMITSAGAGFSRIHDLAVNRWREDVTQDHYGIFFYLKDCESGDVWSAGHQPVCVDALSYEAIFSEDRVRIIREDNSIKSELEIFVSTEENAEIRQVTLTNLGFSTRELEITSYSEVVINTHAADVAHPTFSNLFVETEYLSELSSLIANRRPRSVKERPLWLTHTLRGDHHSIGGVQFETDRAQFIGRGRTTRNPMAVQRDHKLSGTVGPVLDPIVSLRTRIRLAPGESSKVIFSIGVAESREAVIVMAEKFGDPSLFERAGDLSWLHAQVKLHHLGIEPDEAHLFQRLLSRLIFLDSSLRPPSEILKRNTKDVTGLWAHGISGDHPLVVVRIDDFEGRNFVRQLLKAQIYCATKGFISDLVILNEKGASYSQDLQLELESMAHSAHVPSGPSAFERGKVFVLRGDLISEADHYLLASEARAIFSTRDGSLSDQVKRTRVDLPLPPKIAQATDAGISSLPVPKLNFFNGYGGFSIRENEYIIILKNNEMTPAPWINVIANSEFGFQVSESGAGYTWASNSRENQITPWSNDPICDPPGEAFFIGDKNSGQLWSPTASPIRLPTAVYITHHGQGYSRFETQAHGIYSDLTQFVLVDQPVKISSLVIENRSKKRRSLTVSNYCEWVLGFSRATMAPTTITEFDDESQALLASNPRNPEYGQKVTFSALLQNQTSFTCDRTEFIGRNSNLSEPEALLRNEPLRGATPVVVLILVQPCKLKLI
jgi:cyclic beta-1,2-glucan synthetase